MALGRVDLNLPVMEALLHTPNGATAGALMFVAEDLVQETKVQLSIPRRGRQDRPAAGGPPRARTRDLLNSVKAEPPTFIDGKLTVLLTANAQHRGVLYARILLDGGENGSTAYGPYKFIDLERTRVITPFT